MITKSQDADNMSVQRAAASLTSEKWMQVSSASAASTTVSANEVTSLSALIAYVAHNSGENEFRVERRLADRFNIPNVTCLPSVQFDSAIRYLVDGIR